jgi:hypothetical protein
MAMLPVVARVLFFLQSVYVTARLRKTPARTSPALDGDVLCAICEGILISSGHELDCPESEIIGWP